MTDALFSESWYRVSGMRPRLRTHVDLYRHVYRGDEWFVLEDRSSGTYHRFSPVAYALIGLMTGRSSVDEIWRAACSQLGDDMPTQDEVIRLLSHLHQLDVLQSDLSPDFEELRERHKQSNAGGWRRYLVSPLFMRLPSVDPDRFLERTLFLVRPLFTWTALSVWLVTVVTALVLAALHWKDLTENLVDRVLSIENLALVMLVYPVVKLIHEMGHAYATKVQGGEVHELGMMLMVFFPIPYVDASSAMTFPGRHQRMLVSAAGILVEVFLASLAMVFWTLAEPGPLRAVAFNTMLIAGISTLLFNGNPLLRYDAYYVLADFLEIPNMGSRGKKYWAYLAKRYLLGLKDIESPATHPTEPPWLFSYTLAAFFYRLYIMTRILLLVADRFFLFGVLLSFWSAMGLIVRPTMRMLRELMWITYMQPGKLRIVGTVASISVFFFYMVFIQPIPDHTLAEGVVWAPEESRVHAAAGGFVRRVVAVPGSEVTTGTPLIECHDPAHGARVAALEAELSEFKAKLREQEVTDRIQADILQDEIKRITAELDLAKEKERDLVITSKVSGIFLLPDAEDMEGRFLQRGMAVGYVVDFERMRVRTVVTQDDIDKVRTTTQSVEACLAHQMEKPVTAVILSQIPQATHELPSLALGMMGGGTIAQDPASGGKPMSFMTLFHIDLALPGLPVSVVGERVHVRFVHEPAPLIKRIVLGVRRLFLRRFGK